MRSGLVAASALALGAAAACGHEPGDDLRLVYQSDRGGPWAIYAMRPDGTRVERIARIGGYSGGVVFWSRRGERLLIPRETARGGDAAVLDVSSARRTRVRVHVVGGASWSPDARRLAVAAERGIVMLDADGSNRRQLTFQPADFGPEWSPDGDRIAFASGDDLYSVDVDGMQHRVVHVPNGDVVPMCWSHDGSSIVFSYIDAEGRAPLEAVRRDGSGRRRLARNADLVTCSPRAPTLVYVLGSDLYRVDLNGRGAKRLTFDGLDSAFERSPAWSPDGERIAYVRARLPPEVRDPNLPTDVWVMNADGSGKRPLTRAFPTGGTFALPGWIEVEPEARAVASPPRLVSLPERTILRTTFPVGGIAARGSTAVLVQGLGSGTEFDNPPGPLLVWEPTRGRVRRIPVTGCGTAFSPAIVAELLVYACDNSAVDLFASEIRAVSAGGRTATIVSLRATHLVGGVPFTSRLHRGVAASGEAIAFAVGERPDSTTDGFLARETTIWRVDANRVRRLGALAGDATLLDADRMGLALLQRGDVVLLDAATGTVRRRLRFRPNDVRDVELGESTIAVLRRERLSVYDLTTGDERAGVRLRRDLGSPQRLGGVDGDLAVYVAGLEVHVARLSEGRDVVLDLRAAAGPAYARLTDAGLFYSYTETRRSPGGRAVFVPRATLERALTRAP